MNEKTSVVRPQISPEKSPTQAALEKVVLAKTCVEIARLALGLFSDLAKHIR